MRRLLLLLILSLSFSTYAWADTVELQNDGFVDGTAAGFQGGFADGEAFAGKFSLSADQYPLTILSFKFLYGGATSSTTVTPYVWDENGTGIGAGFAMGTAGFPGSVIYLATTDFELTGSNEAWQTIDLSNLNIQIPSGGFWAGMVVKGGFPGPARDDDGGTSAANINAIKDVDDNWVENTNYGVAGDWIIRVTVETSTGTVEELDVTDDTGAPDVVEDTSPDVEEDTADLTQDEEEDIPAVVALSVTEISPTQGSYGDATDVIIRGTGFVEGVTVRLGTASLEDLRVESDALLTATVPADLEVGTYDLYAQIPGQNIFEYPAAFEIVDGEVVTPDPAPAIGQVTPTSGAAGDMVTVTGAGFQDGMTATLGGEDAIFNSSGDTFTEFTFRVPNLSAGTYDLIVTNPDDQSDTLTAAFQVVDTTSGSDDEGCGCSTLRTDAPYGASAGTLLFALFALVAMRRRAR